MLMFAILFGLSMDYNVFLLSAVREERRRGGTAGTAVVRAIGRTAGLIGTAGAIMTLVFAGLVADSETEVKMIGLGLATAVLIDVTLVRLVLAPAILEVPGGRAWWAPRRPARPAVTTHPAPVPASGGRLSRTGDRDPGIWHTGPRPSGLPPPAGGSRRSGRPPARRRPRRKS